MPRKARRRPVLTGARCTVAASTVRSLHMTFIEEAVTSINERLNQLRLEIDRLTHARDALVANGAGTPAPAKPARARRPARRRAPTKPMTAGTEVAPAGRLHKLLADSDGLSTAALAERANADPVQVLPLLREMEVAGRVRRTGQRRDTRWYAVASPEDWIEQRAAELAAQSGRSRPRAAAKRV